MRRGIVVIVATLLAACASMEANNRMAQLDDLTRGYARAMQWSDFATAVSAMSATDGTPRPGTSALQDIKVTSYEPVSAQIADNGKKATRVVRIGYVRLSRMSELSLTVQEEWVYSDTDKRWSLRSGFPEFR